jgi:hypothetical protein
MTHGVRYGVGITVVMLDAYSMMYDAMSMFSSRDDCFDFGYLFQTGA